MAAFKQDSPVGTPAGDRFPSWKEDGRDRRVSPVELPAGTLPATVALAVEPPLQARLNSDTPFSELKNFSSNLPEPILRGWGILEVNKKNSDGNCRIAKGQRNLDDTVRSVLTTNAKQLESKARAYAGRSIGDSFYEVEKGLAPHRLIKIINLNICGSSRAAGSQQLAIEVFI